MDVNDPTSSPFGAQFVPRLPTTGVEPSGIIPFTNQDAIDFETYLTQSTNRKMLSSARRAHMKDILQNPNIQFSEHIYGRAEKGRLQNLKVWTLKHFELQDMQIYRKAEKVYNIEYNARYATCTYDAFELIARTHRGLHHAGTFSYSFIKAS